MTTTNTIKGRWLRLLFCAAPLLLAGPVFAEGDEGAEASTNGAIGWQPIKRITFSPDDVEGQKLTPDGENIQTIVSATQPSLIELRLGFEAEIIKTMEDM
jgi:hypothetical protein